jgi:hypothetical protein
VPQHLEKLHHEKLRHETSNHARPHHERHAQSAAPHRGLSDLYERLDQSVRHAKSVNRESDVSAARQRQR